MTSAASPQWVELRVHGVSGTPPESLLGTPHVRQVAGDDYSRFFRPVPEPTDHVVEAYHWGRFTSGNWRQSLTLLLVPFGIVNATQFMLPEPVTAVGKVLHAVAGACLRATALVLTYLFTFALSLILIDLVGWRWADKTRLLTSFPDDRVLQVSVLASAAGVLLLSLMGWSGQTRQPPGDATALEGGSRLGGAFYSVDPNAPTLRWLHVAAGFGLVALLADLARTGDDPGADGGSFRVLVVAGILLVCGVVVLLGDPENAVSVTWGRAQALPDRWHGVVRRLAPVLAASTGALVLVAVARLDGVDRKDAVIPAAARRLVDFDRVADGLMYGGIAAMALLYVVVVAHLWRGDRYAWTRREAAARLVELLPVATTAVVAWQVGDGWVRGLAVVVAAVLVGLAGWAGYRVAVPGTPSGEDAFYFRPYAGGMSPFLLASLGVSLAVGFSAAAATAVSSTLNLDVNVTLSGDKVKVGTTPMLDRVSYAWGLTVVVIVAILVVIGVRYLMKAGGYRAKTEQMYQPSAADPTTLPSGWIGRVVRATYLGQLKNHLPGISITFATVGLAIAGVQGYESVGCGRVDGGPVDCPHAPGLLTWLSQPRDDVGSIFLINIGAGLFVAGAGLVVTISRGAFKNAGLRRGINIVWDIFSFWPHAVHPFVPRPYSRWTVVELRNRIRFHLGGRAGVPPDPVAAGRPEVVVCAHSQGTLISLAALMQLTPAERDRVAFLSCGSQLRVIYPRAFPAYVNLGAITWLFDALGGRWVNLYRVTDLLAGPVLSWKHDETGSRHFPLAPGGVRADDDWVAGTDRCRRSGNDWRLIDPVAYDANCETGPVEVVHGHHNYWLDAAWTRGLEHLRRREPT
jgi:hypothetical protein